MWRTISARTRDALRAGREGAEVFRGREGAAQISSVVRRHTTGQMYATMRITVASQHRSSAAKRQAQEAPCRPAAPCGEHHNQFIVYLVRGVGIPVFRSHSDKPPAGTASPLCGGNAGQPRRVPRNPRLRKEIHAPQPCPVRSGAEVKGGASGICASAGSARQRRAARTPAASSWASARTAASPAARSGASPSARTKAVPTITPSA